MVYSIDCVCFSSSATTRQLREIYNSRSGEEPIVQYSEEDQQFQAILVKAIQVNEE